MVMHILFKLSYKCPMQLVAEVLHSLPVMPQDHRGSVVRELALWLSVSEQNETQCLVQH